VKSDFSGPHETEPGGAEAQESTSVEEQPRGDIAAILDKVNPQRSEDFFLGQLRKGRGMLCTHSVATGWIEHPFETKEQALDLLDQHRATHNVYVTMGTLCAGATSRSATNVESLNGFFLDLDCHGGVGEYANPKEAWAALVAFCGVTGVPMPDWRVASGHGLHGHWHLSEPVSRKVWLPVAKKLKTLVASQGLKTDKRITADAARVLRVPGSFNFRDPAMPVDVALLAVSGARTQFVAFEAAVDAALAKAPHLAASTTLVPTVDARKSGDGELPDTPLNRALLPHVLALTVDGRRLFDPDAKRDDSWLTDLFSICALGDWAYEAARDWSESATLKGKFDPDQFDIDWRSFDPDRVDGITARSFFHKLGATGFNPPFQNDGEVFEPLPFKVRNRPPSRLTEKLLAGLASRSCDTPLLPNSDIAGYLQDRSQGPIRATPFAWPDPGKIPPRPWVFGRWLLRNTITTLVAPGGVGKSTFMTTTALSLASGRDLLGKAVWSRAQRVWLWNLEDDADELARSTLAASQLHLITPQDCGDRLFVDSGLTGRGLCTAIEDRSGFRIMKPEFDAILAELVARQIDVLIVDPFVSSHAVNENDNRAIDAVAKEWARVAAAANCAIVLSHHARKVGGESVTSETARGASALVNAARSALVFNRMTKSEATKLGIVDDQERRRIFSVHDDKHNRAPAEAADWFYIEAVLLPNNDSVGVARPWAPPVPAASMTPQQARAVQQIIASGQWREHHQSTDWAGVAAADVLGLDPKGDRTRIKRVLDGMIEGGFLRVVERPDGSRKQRKFLEVDKWVGAAPPNLGGAD
jgi:hypothetical protein